MHRHLLCRSHDHSFAIPIRGVEAIEATPRAVGLPSAPAHIRGLVRMRGRLVVLYDLRRFFGLPGRHEEAAGRLADFRQRRQDHIDWLDALERSILTGEPFRKAIDPTQCAFGRWYATFRSPDPTVNVKLLAFDEPHRAIHALAAKLLARPRDEALLRLRAAREGELAELLLLFSALEPHIANEVPEVTVVVGHRDGSAALAVDEAHELTGLSLEPAHGVPGHELAPGHRLVSAIAHEGGRTIYVLDPDRLAAEAVLRA